MEGRKRVHTPYIADCSSNVTKTCTVVPVTAPNLIPSFSYTLQVSLATTDSITRRAARNNKQKGFAGGCRTTENHISDWYDYACVLRYTA